MFRISLFAGRGANGRIPAIRQLSPMDLRIASRVRSITAVTGPSSRFLAADSTPGRAEWMPTPRRPPPRRSSTAAERGRLRW